MSSKRTKPAFSDQTTPMVGGTSPLLPVLLRAIGTNAAAEFRLASGSAFVGTSKGAHLILSEPTVSRQHCEVELCAGGVRVTDLDSKNGTFYLGQRIDAIVLPIGATFSVGNVVVAILPDVAEAKVPPSEEAALGPMLGYSLAMRTLFTVVKRVASTDVSVLLEGEPGVGKETVARTIHELGAAAKPFESFVIGAVPREALFEELLGPGGAIDRAQSGTIYLRDLDALPAEVQSALLARLERHDGARGPSRVIASTTKSLEDEVRSGAFSSELFFRCSVVRLPVPPMRDRREDIAPLAARFAAQAGVPALPSEVIETLKTRSLPGNLRELESLVRAFGALGTLPAPARVRGSLLELALEEVVDPARPYAELKDALVERFTERYLRELLRHTAGNQSVAARLAGMDRTYLGRLLARYQLR